jgi:uncharacterized protein with HEPN domain
MTRDDQRQLDDWLRDIVEFGDRLAGHIRDADRDEFRATPILQDAVIRCIEVIGEASHNALQTDPGFSERFPEMRDAYWTRNRIAHGYYDLNPDRVWLTATVSVPALVAKVRDHLSTAAGGGVS